MGEDTLLDKMREESIMVISDLIDKGTRRGQFNSGDMAMTLIVGILSKKVEKGEININELFDMLDGKGYKKNLSKYVGKVTGMELTFKK